MECKTVNHSPPCVRGYDYERTRVVGVLRNNYENATSQRVN